MTEITRIIQENLVWNLSESEREDGFLSVDLAADQVIRFNESIPIIVGELEKSLVGFLMGSTLSESPQIPILARMFDCYNSVRFDGRFLSDYRSYVYGPVCVDRAYRGQGVLEKLFSECRTQLADRFEVGVLFISAENQRSIAAHRRKLGMELVGAFEFNQQTFHVLAFHLAGPSIKNARRV